MTYEEQLAIGVDQTKIFLGYGYDVNDYLHIRQPTVGEVVEYGETRFMSDITPFITNPTQYRVPLWRAHIDWCTISDYKLFLMLVGDVAKDISQLLFGGFDFGALRMVSIDATGDIVLCNKDNVVVIDESTYTRLSEFMRQMMLRHPKVEVTKNKLAKKLMIEDDQNKMRRIKDEDKPHPHFLPLIRAAVNHPGFKYNTQQVKNVGINEFLLSVKQLQLYQEATAIQQGQYSGMLDTSKIKNLEKLTNWLRPDI